MRLVKARIEGFQSFADSGDIEFSDGINLIIGQNNSGKSALLRALLPSIPDDRHRSKDRWEGFMLAVPKVSMEFGVSGGELKKYCLKYSPILSVPVPFSDEKYIEFMEKFFSSENINITLIKNGGGSYYSNYPSHNLFVSSGELCKSVSTRLERGDLNYGLVVNDTSDGLPALLYSVWHMEMFYFSAERLNIGERAIDRSDRLEPDARNLPNVLHTLFTERNDVFNLLVVHLREVFSSVGNISVSIKPASGLFEIRVWPTIAMERIEHSFPLNASGTGVSQVLAILAAIMTMDKAVIIIDEINSFLHPAAVKALLRIIQTHYSHHQYIITTHSPEVISYSNPSTVHLVKRDGYESTVERLDLGNLENFRYVADHLGVSMSDVFAAERIIWVEGPTEELCFPYLLQATGETIPRGTLMTSVSSTGDFITKKRDKAFVYDVYQRLCSATNPLVKSVIFSFDSELLSDDDKQSMIEESGQKMHFLPRRHLECYLIDPDAIAAFINDRDKEPDVTVTPEAVLQELKAKAKEPTDDIDNEAWLKRVDAANLIKEVCGALTENRVTFNKKNDSLFLMKHLVGNKSAKLHDLKAYVKGLVEAVTA